MLPIRRAFAGVDGLDVYDVGNDYAMYHLFKYGSKDKGKDVVASVSILLCAVFALFAAFFASNNSPHAIKDFPRSVRFYELNRQSIDIS
jgi:hypothetical protein